MTINAEGAKHADLLDAAKLTCSTCGGTRFQVEATTSNAGAKGTEGLVFLCHCGQVELFDFQALGATADYT